MLLSLPCLPAVAGAAERVKEKIHQVMKNFLTRMPACPPEGRAKADQTRFCTIFAKSSRFERPESTPLETPCYGVRGCRNAFYPGNASHVLSGCLGSGTPTGQMDKFTAKAAFFPWQTIPLPLKPRQKPDMTSSLHLNNKRSSPHERSQPASLPRAQQAPTLRP